MGYIMQVIGLAQGYRTQVIMAVYVVVKSLEVLGILNKEQTDSIDSILLPLAGITFAAKVNNVTGTIRAILPKN